MASDDNARQKIYEEMDERQSILENLGFKVERSEHLYEAALNLVAEKDNVVLKITRFLRGGRDLSMVIKRDGYETTVPLYPYKFDDVLAVVNAAISG